MKSLSVILFILGIPWALIAWMAVFGGPFGAIEDLSVALRTHARLFEAIVQVPFLLMFSAQAVVGYVIWAGWLLIASGKAKASRMFWALAAVHHLAWVLYAGVLCWRKPILPILYYSTAVFLVCVAAALASGRGKRPDRLQDALMTPLGA